MYEQKNSGSNLAPYLQLRPFIYINKYEYFFFLEIQIETL